MVRMTAKVCSGVAVTTACRRSMSLPSCVVSTRGCTSPPLVTSASAQLVSTSPVSRLATAARTAVA